MLTLASARVNSRRSLAIRVAPADRAASNMAAPGTTARPMTCERRKPSEAGAQGHVLHAAGLLIPSHHPRKLGGTKAHRGSARSSTVRYQIRAVTPNALVHMHVKLHTNTDVCSSQATASLLYWQCMDSKPETLCK